MPFSPSGKVNVHASCSLGAGSFVNLSSQLDCDILFLRYKLEKRLRSVYFQPSSEYSFKIELEYTKYHAISQMIWPIPKKNIIYFCFYFRQLLRLFRGLVGDICWVILLGKLPRPVNMLGDKIEAWKNLDKIATSHVKHFFYKFKCNIRFSIVHVSCKICWKPKSRSLLRELLP